MTVFPLCLAATSLADAKALRARARVYRLCASTLDSLSAWQRTRFVDTGRSLQMIMPNGSLVRCKVVEWQEITTRPLLPFTIWTVTVDDGATKEFSVLRCDVTSGGDLKNDNDERIPFQWIDPTQDPVKEGK